MTYPLSGITVLELGQVYGAPYCSHLLGQLGARVIKIETPGRGDPLRDRGGRRSGAEPIGFQLLNGGKESVALDLKSEEGRRSFTALARSADVIVENFAPGTAKALGADYATMREVNPRLVYASLKAYSADSPNWGQRGMDLTVQASSGVMSVNGFPDGPPVRCGPSLADFLGGSHLAMGVLAALFERTVTGTGQLVDVSLQDAVLPTLTSNFAAWLTDPAHAFERTGNRHGGMRESPYNVYPTTDGWIAVLCINVEPWRSLCTLIGRPDLRDDPTLDTADGRSDRMLEIDDAISAWTSTRTNAEASAELQSAGVPGAPLKTVLQVIDDEMHRTEPMLRRTEDTDGRVSYTYGSPIRLSDHPPMPAGRIPALDEHDVEVALDDEDEEVSGGC
jgi:formyl-CoA transferase